MNIRLFLTGLAASAALLVAQSNRVFGQTGIVYIGPDALNSTSVAYFINSDGTGKHQIPLDLVGVDHPKWSRDGALIVAQGTSSNGSSPDVFTFNRFGGSSLHQVTTIGSIIGYTVAELFPTLSPDSKHVVVNIWYQRTSDSALCAASSVFSINGVLEQILYPPGLLCGEPGGGFDLSGTGVDWSPKASLIVSPLGHIVPCGPIVSLPVTQIVAGPPVAGSTPTAVTNPNPCLTPGIQIYDVWPAFSPDGTKVAYVRLFINHSAGTGASEVRIVNLDGSNDHQVASFLGEVEQGISWSPTGTQLLFDRSQIAGGTFQPGSLGLWKINTDGTGLAQFVGPVAAIPNWAFANTVPGQLLNISTRALVQTGDNVLIGGFIISGNSPKQVLVRAIGPSLPPAVPNRMQDPMISLHDSTTAQIDSNDDWQSRPNANQIPANLQPGDPRESAILTTLQPGSYTAIVSGKGGATGVALAEVYDMDTAATSELANISTRGLVQTGDFVMIGGFVPTGTGNIEVLIRAIGPSLAGAGIANALPDPTVSVFNSQGAVIGSNDNWRDKEAEILATGKAPTNNLESAVILNLASGTGYTAIVSDKNGASGIGEVEVFKLQ